MLYYSEVTGKNYKTEKECLMAENAVKIEQEKERIRKEKEAAERDKIAAERKEAAARVEEARKAMVAAQNEYKKVLSAFVDKYHSYHYTTTDASQIPTLFNFLDSFWG